MTLTPTKGHLLVSEPSILGDISFNRSVILLAEHTAEGSVGFIVNKPLEYSLCDIVKGIGTCDFPIYNGGPVEQDNLYFIHNVPHLIEDSQEISSGIFWGGNFERAMDMVLNKKIDTTQIKFFLGYSGWASHQLDQELKQHSWVLLQNSNPTTLITASSIELWRDLIMQIGGDYLLWSNAPENPQLN